jgi:hypothetical protein
VTIINNVLSNFLVIKNREEIIYDVIISVDEIHDSITISYSTCNDLIVGVAITVSFTTGEDYNYRFLYLIKKLDRENGDEAPSYVREFGNYIDSILILHGDVPEIKIE